jgi:hypothetical protein
MAVFATIGHMAAVVDLRGFISLALIAWWFWIWPRMCFFSIGFRNRVAVLLDGRHRIGLINCERQDHADAEAPEVSDFTLLLSMSNETPA